jgi:hypothetical protein
MLMGSSQCYSVSHKASVDVTTTRLGRVAAGKTFEPPSEVSDNEVGLPEDSPTLSLLICVVYNKMKSRALKGIEVTSSM